MVERKTETFIYQDLGFPIVLVDVPLRKSFGEWVLDINLNQLQSDVLFYLIHKKAGLTGSEVRFIRKYLEMTTTEFAKAFGVTHAAVLKWESGENGIMPTTDLCIRLFILRKLNAKNEEFGKLIYEILPEQLLQTSNETMRIEKYA